ncbi:MAG: Fic family protein [Deltaproteobacteria bacterium]|nr:Fic family protein [Deltaproteobacteria bacterium]
MTVKKAPLQELLREIDENRTLLRRRGPLKAIEQKSVDTHFRILNTFTSNAIEGNSFSYLDTKLWLVDGITVAGKSRNELLEVSGHGAAFDSMLAIARESTLDGISKNLPDIILRLHRMFYREIDPEFAGVFRESDVIIFGSPLKPPGPEFIGDFMDDFRVSFAENKDRLHPVVLAAFAHLALVQIHPFVDGNGRTSRLLMNLILVNGGYQILSFNMRDRNRYYTALRNSDDQQTVDNHFTRLIARLELKAQKKYMELIRFKPPGQDASGSGPGDVKPGEKP